jgi:hydroxymethylglutaryl-CoA lyase
VKRLSDREGIIFTGLVLNDKGLDRASDCGLTHVAISCSVSDAHSRRNVNRPAAEALESVAGLAGAAVSAGMTVRAGLQCAFGCVYEGAIPPARVLAAAETMAAAGVHEINLADTTGMANPATIRALCGEVTRRFPDLPVILHLHDTRALGVSNMLAGYESGVRIFDVCAGGLGGCPFVKGAAGNVPTEDGVYLFESMGVPTGISLAGIAEVVEHLETVLERPLPGRLARVVRASRELSLVPPLSE